LGSVTGRNESLLSFSCREKKEDRIPVKKKLRGGGVFVVKGRTHRISCMHTR